MNCPKCTGLLTREEMQEHSGRFHGWRCIQCGLRLDQTIAQNARPAAVAVAPAPSKAAGRPGPSARHKRPVRAV